jgi:hydrogenase maturation protein HypF
VETCGRVRDATGLAAVALSGGTFQNLLLLERVMSGLESAGFSVYRHRRVPANDGGISLGQAMVAGAVLGPR